jgi:elongation factor 2 kinase
LDEKSVGYLRSTPQAFSHFTYQNSRKKEMVVDMQGVGNLLTDPQMHTINQSYGLGDLGAKGFAKFFHNHICNQICRYMKLDEFQIEVKMKENFC